MRAVLQRVRRASVSVDGRIVAEIGAGYLVLIGFGGTDHPDMIDTPLWTRFLQKIPELRLFPGQAGPIDVSLRDHGGDILLVSQFTLYADARKGRRPSFSGAARPETARILYDAFAAGLSQLWPRVSCGVFGADMDVSLVNWGPVTLCLDSETL